MFGMSTFHSLIVRHSGLGCYLIANRRQALPDAELPELLPGSSGAVAVAAKEEPFKIVQ